MYAVMIVGGKQYKVQEGDVIFVEKLEASEGEKVAFDQVLAVNKDGKLEIGEPLLANAKVTASVIKNGKGKKIIVYKMKPKKGYRRKQGHRQHYTKLQIEKIEG